MEHVATSNKAIATAMMEIARAPISCDAKHVARILLTSSKAIEGAQGKLISGDVHHLSQFRERSFKATKIP
jgi:hypothetical protein